PSNRTVADLLLEISKQSNLAFRQINNAIYVQRRDDAGQRGKERVEVFQTVTITGKVISHEDSQGLPGVNVVVKGTSFGTVTDINGVYKIDVPSSETTLVFSSVGYVTEEIEVGNQTTIDLTMVPDLTALDEI